jgi:hypothetical protein
MQRAIFMSVFAVSIFAAMNQLLAQLKSQGYTNQSLQMFRMV